MSSRRRSHDNRSARSSGRRRSPPDGRHSSRHRRRSRSPHRDAERHVRRRSARSERSHSPQGEPDARRETGKPGSPPQNAATTTPSTATAEREEAKEPQSLEALIQARQAKEAEEAKPKFLTRQERAALALKRRQQEVELQRQRQEEERAARQAFMKQSSRVSSHFNDHDDYHPRRRSRDGNSRYRDRSPPRSDRRGSSHRSSRDSSSAAAAAAAAAAAGDEEEHVVRMEADTRRIDGVAESVAELQAIKRSYLSTKRKKRKIVKATERFTKGLDWDLDDDTSNDINPLYSERAEVRPMFGRGLMGGIDAAVQADIWGGKSVDQLRDMARRAGGSGTGPSGYRMGAAGTSGKHWSEKLLSEMTQRDWRIFKEDYSITTRGGNIPWPLRSWEECTRLPKELHDAIRAAGYTEPSPIQRQGIPLGLAGRDVLGVAETGSGKTATFVLPMLVYISRLPRMTRENATQGPYALVLAPTRELAIQIEAETAKFATFVSVRTCCVVGGQSIEDQGFVLRQGCEVVIATPGRLVDCIERRYLVLNQCNYVVLDEADRMIDMGFESAVQRILDYMPTSNMVSEDETEAEQQRAAMSRDGAKPMFRTTIMFSATMPPPLERMARAYLRHPAYVTIGEAGQAANRIRQHVVFVRSENEKRQRLSQLLSQLRPPIMVFANLKKNCEALAKHLNSEGWSSTSIHGGRNQDQRESAMSGFKEGQYDILVATDVAGRGIDVQGVTHVINYDAPLTIESYTHRIGRTGRAGSEGEATTFLTNDDQAIFYDLKQMLVASGNTVPSELAQHKAARQKPGAVSRRDMVNR